MRALIVSLGSIGRRHLTNLRLIEPDAHISVWRQSPESRLRGTTTPEGADLIVHSLEDALATDPDIALITGPASIHMENGISLAQHGVHLFIEKPLSNTLDRIDVLMDICRKQSLALAIGYNFRFYRPLQIIRQALRDGRIGRVLSLRVDVGQYLPDWRPGADYRQGVSAQSDLGGGAVLELSHELDYVRWLIGEVDNVTARVAQLSDLEIDVEDSADIILTFENGVVGNIHLDMVQRIATRTCRIIGTKGTIDWDGGSHRVRVYSADVNGWDDLHPAAKLDVNETYIAELRQFLECVNVSAEPVVSVEDGVRALKIALAAKKSSRIGRTVEI